MSVEPRPEVAGIEPCYHGGIDYAELKALGFAPEKVVDFSVCTNPFMPPPGVKKALQKIAIGQYPDSQATELKERLSKKLGVEEDNILVGSGVIELIRLLALAYLRKADLVLVLEPTFGEYELVCEMLGARVAKQWAKEKEAFRPQVEKAVDFIKERHPRAVFICNPNNPTGVYLWREDIETILDSLEGGLLILDEAYISFVDGAWSSLKLISSDNLVILRSMTKDFGLAGLRIGYAISSREIIANLRKVCPPWNVSVVAQKIGTFVLEREDYLAQTKVKVKRSKEFLIKELSRLGLPPLPSETHFFLLKVGKASKFRHDLLKEGILVRDCTSFGLPEYVRISPRTINECRRLVSAVEKVLHQSGLEA